MDDDIREGLRLIFAGIARLRQAHDQRRFTIDGRLVGDIGEVIAEIEYDLTLDRVSQRDHDATDCNGRRVQIKATFKDSLTFKTCPDFYLGLWLKSDGTFEEVYNGPGDLIQARFGQRKGIGEDLLSFPLSTLRKLSASVDPSKRIPRRRTG